MPIIFPIEPLGKILLFSLNKKDWSFYELGIIYGILHQEYLKMPVKKVNTFNSIEFFFSIYKNLIFHLCLNMAKFFKKIVLSGRIRHLKKNNIERTRRWLGLENEENVARTRSCCGWPSSPRSVHKCIYLVLSLSWIKKGGLQSFPRVGRGVYLKNLNFFPHSPKQANWIF